MAPTYGTIRVIAGSGAGRTLKLSKMVSVIGSGKGADLLLDGEKVAENHASIEASPDGTCVLRNRSPFGTLVNKSRIDVHRLADGDRIQIGAAALLEFHGVGSKAPSGGPGQSKKIMIGVALGVYLIAMAALVMKLQGVAGGDGGAFSSGELETALTETRTAFVAKLDDPKTPPTFVPVDADDATVLYYGVINARAGGADEASMKTALDAFMTALGQHLQEASALERQERWKEARAEYREVLEMVPDVKLSAAKLAASRLAATQEKLTNE